jgi:hypothetical protein
MKPLEPVQFGDPTPGGRKTGDCKLCATDGKADAAFCDCQLRYTQEPEQVVRWVIGNEGLRGTP